MASAQCRRVPVLFASVMLAAGCERFTEYSGPPSAGLVFIDPVSLEVTGSIQGVQGARALSPGTGSLFFVSTTTGMLYRCDSEAMALLSSTVIGPGSGAGYGSIAYVPWENSIYVQGATGNILELDAATGLLLDDFTVGSSVASIIPGRSSNNIYIADPVGGKVYRVRTATNTVARSWSLNLTPTVLCMNGSGSDSVLAATSDPLGSAYILPFEQSAPARKVRLAPAWDMASSYYMGIIAAASPDHGSGQGRVMIIDSLSPFTLGRILTVPGNPERLATHTDGMRLFIASRNGPDGFTLYSYHMGTWALLGSVDLPGTPVDMAAAGNRLVVLTY